MSASLPPSTFNRFNRDNATQLYARADAPTMTWADIEADRMARGLDLPVHQVAPKVTRAKRAPSATGPRMVNGADARLPSNLTRCTAPAFNGALPTSKATAASLRRKAMAVCNCRLCNLALCPALTFEDHAAFVGPMEGPERAPNGFDNSTVKHKRTPGFGSFVAN